MPVARGGPGYWGLPAHSSRRARVAGAIGPPPGRPAPRWCVAPAASAARLDGARRASWPRRPAGTAGRQRARQPAGRTSLGRTGGQGGPASQKVTVPPAFPQRGHRLGRSSVLAGPRRKGRSAPTNGRFRPTSGSPLAYWSGSAAPARAKRLILAGLRKSVLRVSISTSGSRELSCSFAGGISARLKKTLDSGIPGVVS